MKQTLTISQSASDYLGALYAEKQAAERQYNAALTVLLREHGVPVNAAVVNIGIDGTALTVETADPA